MDKKDLPIIPSDRADDLHNLEIADSADLVLFMAGNQFMAMDELIAGFQQEYPDVKNIFYETLPPGLELKQILSGGAVYKAEGTTIYTIVHHRETPLRISKKTVDAGPVWATEVMHAQKSGLAFEVVEPAEDLDQREHINYYVCKLLNALHPLNAQKFINFILSSPAQQIYQKYGFVPYSN